MDLALNDLQRLICHKTKQTKPNQTWINRHENKIEIKKELILILNFEFNLI